MYSTILCVFVVLMVCALPGMAAEDKEESSGSDEEEIDYMEWIKPSESFNEVEASPAGEPLKKLVRLVFGFVILYGAARIIKAWFKMKSDDGESASDGYLGMGHATVSMLALMACIAFYFYFTQYKF